MSRYTKKDGPILLAYGYDHAVGLFLQKFDENKITLENEKGIVLDEDELFGELTQERFENFLQGAGITKDEINKVIKQRQDG